MSLIMYLVKSLACEENARFNIERLKSNLDLDDDCWERNAKYISLKTIITNAHQLAAWSSCISSSSFESGTVLWLYKPWAISCRARGFFCPVDFLIFALLFWNQIFIWASFSPSSALRACRLFSVKYRFSLNSCFKEKKKRFFVVTASLVYELKILFSPLVSPVVVLKRLFSVAFHLQTWDSSRMEVSSVVLLLDLSTHETERN